jgi:hypothetical protein
MPVNHADGMTAGAIVCSPVVAGIAAASAGARWSIPIFVGIGFLAGIVLAYLINKSAYWILDFGGFQKGRPLLDWLAIAVYIIAPMALVAGGGLAIWLGTIWLARQIH